MEIFSREIQLSVIKIELSVQKREGCRVIFTAKDKTNGIIWKTPLKDSQGNTKIYPTVADAFQDAEAKLKIYSSTV